MGEHCGNWMGNYLLQGMRSGIIMRKCQKETRIKTLLPAVGSFGSKWIANTTCLAITLDELNNDNQELEMTT